MYTLLGNTLQLFLAHSLAVCEKFEKIWICSHAKGKAFEKHFYKQVFWREKGYNFSISIQK